MVTQDLEEVGMSTGTDSTWHDDVVAHLLALKDGETHLVSRRGRTVEVEVRTKSDGETTANRLYVATLIDQSGRRRYRRFLHLPTQRSTDTAAVHLAELIAMFCEEG